MKATIAHIINPITHIINQSLQKYIVPGFHYSTMSMFVR